MSKELFSINAAANLLERDRGTITRAVRDVPPDGHDKQGNARWKMSTIVAALGHTGGGSSRFTAIADNLEAAGNEILAALKKLRATPDVAARRKLVQGGLCKCIGKLVDVFEAGEAALGPGERGAMAIVKDVATGQAIAEVMRLCNWQIDPAELTRKEKQ
jgi:hypothetical protein